MARSSLLSVWCRRTWMAASLAALAWSAGSPCRCPADGAISSLPLHAVDSSSRLASNSFLYRSSSFCSTPYPTFMPGIGSPAGAMAAGAKTLSRMATASVATGSPLTSIIEIAFFVKGTPLRQANLNCIVRVPLPGITRIAPGMICQRKPAEIPSPCCKSYLVSAFPFRAAA
jgi:hypothetical protein